MVLRIGHRGAAGYEPENTLRSFKKALDLKIDMLEMDVQLCKSGEIVVIHDLTVDRTTNGNGAVMKKTFEELRLLDAGKQEKIPQLCEVLDFIDRQAKLNIELKGKTVAGPVFALIEKYKKKKNWRNEDFIISSFDLSQLKEIRKLSSKLKIGVLVENVSAESFVFCRAIGAYSLNLPKQALNREIVDVAHKSALKVFVFTLNEDAQIRDAKKLRVDGIFSDFPDRI